MSDISVASDSEQSFPLDQRIHSLEEEHSQLEAALAEEEARPMPDSITIKTLKRKKLAIKDELAALTDS
jgi:hypothetical protein